MKQPDFDIYPQLDRDIEAIASKVAGTNRQGFDELVRYDLSSRKEPAPPKPAELNINLELTTDPDGLQAALNHLSAKSTYEVYEESQEAEEKLRKESGKARDEVHQSDDLTHILNYAQYQAELGEFEKAWEYIFMPTGLSKPRNELIKTVLQPIVLDWAKQYVLRAEAVYAMDLVEEFAVNPQYMELLHKAMDYEILKFIREHYEKALEGEDFGSVSVYIDDLMGKYGMSDEDKEKILAVADPLIFSKAREIAQEDKDKAFMLTIENTSSELVGNVMRRVLGIG